MYAEGPKGAAFSCRFAANEQRSIFGQPAALVIFVEFNGQALKKVTFVPMQEWAQNPDATSGH